MEADSGRVLPDFGIHRRETQHVLQLTTITASTPSMFKGSSILPPLNAFEKIFSY